MGLEVVEGVHIAGVPNIVCDGMSRDHAPAEYGFSDEDCIDVGNSEVLQALLEACNPLNDTESELGFTAV